MLSQLSLKTSYHKGRDDIAHDFYLPCMRLASEYDRAVGYFRSTVFIVAWPALKEFVHRGATMRVLCSHVLSPEDVDALEEGYAAREEASTAACLLEETRSLLRDDVLREPARVLAALVARGNIEIKIAVFRNRAAAGVGGRIFHDKLGIFRDSDGDSVMFKGSMNETWAGLAADGNLESIDVAASWMGARDLERTRTEEAYFSDLWNDRYPGLVVRPFPSMARHELEHAAESDWESIVDRLLLSCVKDRGGGDPKGRTLRPHQAAGLSAWVANGRRGILAFATGSGKTFTATRAIREAIEAHGDVVVVIVPDLVLFHQWYAELTEATADLGVRMLRAGAGHGLWREHLGLWTSQGPERRIVLATAQTASTSDFLTRIAHGPHVMLVADEVHRLGAPRRASLLDERLFGARLGLSATPERAGDAAGTSAILSYFRGVLEPRYTLADAVRDRVLTPYFYRPHTVSLTEAEAEVWRTHTETIRRLRGRLVGGDPSGGLANRIQRLLIRRAKVIKQAEGKIPLALEVLCAEDRRDQRWIVYCDDLVQLNAVCRVLAKHGVDAMEYHSKTVASREETLRWLERRGGIVVAIRCLDEGVDIPSVTHALILASSKNPREFIQRRGRVLRVAPGKALAYVHDAIVVPPSPSVPHDASDVDPVAAGELARAVQFATSADNPAAAADLQQIAMDWGIDWRDLVDEGVEDVDE